MLNYIGDRFLRIRLQRDEKEIKIGLIVIAVITIILLFLLGNVIYLNQSLSKKGQITAPSESTVSNPSPTANATESALPSSTPASNSSSTTTAESTIKDYYFNLGSGSNQSNDWADVPGALSTFNIAQYQNIKEVHLETNIDVPTANGTISVRLFNKTDNYAVWNSERTVQSQTKGDLIISPNIIYDVGPRLYQVQMKSQLGVSANLVQSRIHIITK